MKLVPFGWYGGKASMLKSLLPILQSIPHKAYVEPFGGSAAVLLNKRQSQIEIYNDLYSDVVNFFRVLRTQSTQLISEIELTPYSREEYVEAIDRNAVDEVERARRFFVVARQVIMGIATYATPGRWAVTNKHSRRGMAIQVSTWLSAIDCLPRVAERLKQVIIENDDAMNVISRYDGEETLFYLDPPYPLATRSGGKAYANEFDDDKHRQLLDLVKSCKGKFVISSYENDLYSTSLSGWNKIIINHNSHSSRYYKDKDNSRQECLWAKS